MTESSKVIIVIVAFQHGLGKSVILNTVAILKWSLRQRKHFSKYFVIKETVFSFL
jgi:hypothetical protein